MQENCIDLVGRIADRGAEHVPSKEWMRICFELLEMLKAHKKAIRRAAVNTFGYIAKVRLCLLVSLGVVCVVVVVALYIELRRPKARLIGTCHTSLSDAHQHTPNNNQQTPPTNQNPRTNKYTPNTQRTPPTNQRPRAN